MFGPDQTSSLTFQELKQIRNFSDELFLMDTVAYDKDEVFEELKAIKSLFGKVLVLKNLRQKVLDSRRNVDI